MKFEALGALVALFFNGSFVYKRGLCVPTTFILETDVKKQGTMKPWVVWQTDLIFIDF